MEYGGFEQPKTPAPGWVHGTMTKMINQLDGQWNDVMVGACALLGENGFDFGSCEEATVLDPAVYGPVMIQGYTMIAGESLNKIMQSVHAELQHEEHPTHQMEEEERFHVTRNTYEQAIRLWLKSLITYAGERFQRTIAEAAIQDQATRVSLCCGSQMLNMWLMVAEGTMKFHGKPKDEPDGQDSTPTDGT